MHQLKRIRTYIRTTDWPLCSGLLPQNFFLSFTLQRRIIWLVIALFYEAMFKEIINQTPVVHFFFCTILNIHSERVKLIIWIHSNPQAHIRNDRNPASCEAMRNPWSTPWPLPFGTAGATPTTHSTIGRRKCWRRRAKCNCICIR